jgi:hypothetical protein
MGVGPVERLRWLVGEVQVRERLPGEMDVLRDLLAVFADDDAVARATSRDFPSSPQAPTSPDPRRIRPTFSWPTPAR